MLINGQLLLFRMTSFWRQKIILYAAGWFIRALRCFLGTAWGIWHWLHWWQGLRSDFYCWF